ncbi:MAG: DUF116 domain-containing protein, partial [Deltaproteobacteria bacterium]|nr:DUF116 domain-containing protein [Deltaproteobacteria bacterium]
MAVFLALLAGPLLFGRLFMPRLTLVLVRRWGKWVAKVLDRIRPGLDLSLLVKAGNRYYLKTYAQTPFNRRILFLPFCLRPSDCPADVDPEVGLCCQSQCPACSLGALRQEALDRGYAQVFVVPSSRMMPGRGLLPSDQFIRAKLHQYAPSAALGVVCGWHLRHRLLPGHTVGRKGYDGTGTVLQGVLLDSRRCRGATVDWDQVREKVALGSS